MCGCGYRQADKDGCRAISRGQKRLVGLGERRHHDRNNGSSLAQGCRPMRESCCEPLEGGHHESEGQQEEGNVVPRAGDQGDDRN